MEREMAFHVDSLARDYAREGLNDVDAQRAARRQFGNLTRLKERGHDERTMRLAEDVVRDVRHAARGLWRSPGFSLAVILTLALGIGGNTAVFSVVDQLLLRPLPYPEGDQLVMVDEWSRRQRARRRLARQLARLAAREPHVSRIRRLAADVVHDDRRRRAATRERAARVVGVLSAARRRTAPWPHDFPRGRPSERPTRRRAQLPRLAGPAGWRPTCHRSHGADLRATGRDRGRDARRLSLRAARCRPVDGFSARSKPTVAGDVRRTFHPRRRTPCRRRDDRHRPIGDGGHRAASGRDATRSTRT